MDCTDACLSAPILTEEEKRMVEQLSVRHGYYNRKDSPRLRGDTKKFGDDTWFICVNSQCQAKTVHDYWTYYFRGKACKNCYGGLCEACRQATVFVEYNLCAECDALLV
jgi:hypothetical protein